MADKELMLEDIIAKLNNYEEEFKRFVQEDCGSKKEEVMLVFAGWAKEITNPDLRKAVILSFEKHKQASSNSSFTLIEMMLESFKDYVKDRNKENYTECSLEELLDKLSEIAQQVIDLKDP